VIRILACPSCLKILIVSTLLRPATLPLWLATNCSSVLRIDTSLSVWADYTSVNQEIKALQNIIKIAVVSVLSLFAIVGAANYIYEKAPKKKGITLEL
jgi:hypothetical protein